MSRTMRLMVRGDMLEMWKTNSGDGVALFEVPLGDDVFQVAVRKWSPGTHTMPDGGACAPSMDEVAEVAGMIFFESVKQ